MNSHRTQLRREFPGSAAPWRARARILGMGLLLSCAAGTALAQHTLTLRTNYYALTGGSLRDIHHALSRARPWTDARQDGRTEWKINWRTQLAPAGNGCRVESFRTDTSVTITLPRLLAPEGTPPEVLKTWQTYLTALMKHEQGHVRITREAAAKIQAQASAAGGVSCAELRRNLNDRANQLLEACRRAHRDYDRRTNHGATEGAVLPRRLEEPAK